MDGMTTWFCSRGAFKEGEVTGTLKIEGEEIEVRLESVEVLREIVAEERDWEGGMHRQLGKIRRRFVLVEP